MDISRSFTFKLKSFTLSVSSHARPYSTRWVATTKNAYLAIYIVLPHSAGIINFLALQTFCISTSYSFRPLPEVSILWVKMWDKPKGLPNVYFQQELLPISNLVFGSSFICWWMCAYHCSWRINLIIYTLSLMVEHQIKTKMPWLYMTRINKSTGYTLDSIVGAWPQ